jgi:diketogulonate reductase-like aldo/keto reductase
MRRATHSAAKCDLQERMNMKHVDLPDGTRVPALGLGTWKLGESKAAHKAEVAALRTAIELGYRLFDTAEMYGEGGAESVLGEALRGAFAAGDVTRDELFIVSKVYPHNASRRGTAAACERSLARLGLDRIDLYLLHWPGAHPLAETVAAFDALRTQGRIAHWGVSNFDLAGMQDLQRVDEQGHCAANQVWYSASQRGVEFDLLPWQREHQMPLMAYSPIDQAALARNSVLEGIGQRLGASAAQVALAWALRDGRVMAIPKAVGANHLRDNLAAADLALDASALAAIDTAFPPPTRKSALAMI